MTKPPTAGDRGNPVLYWPRLFEGRIIDVCSDANNSRGSGKTNAEVGGGLGAGYYADRRGAGGKDNNQHALETGYYGGKRN